MKKTAHLLPIPDLAWPIVKMVSGEKQDYQIDGISTSFKGDEDNTYFNVGMGVDYQLTNGY